MYQDLFKDVKHNFQPMFEVAAINRKTLARMASVQSQCLSEFISTGINQAKDLSTAGDVKTIADLQFKYLREFEHTLAASAEENISVMSEAKDAISDVLTSNYGRMMPTPLGEMLTKTSGLSTTMPVPVKDKAPARRAAKSNGSKEEGPKVEAREETKAEGPKVAPEAKAESKSDTAKAEAKTSTSEAEAKREPAKEETPKAEAKSAKAEETKSESKSSGNKTTAKSKSSSSSSSKR